MYHECDNTHSEAVSKRLHVTLPDGAYGKLERLAESEARAVANLAAYLIQKALDELDEQGRIPADKSSAK
ncbi:MAG: hypothetical protein KME13_23755 [Myxacorys californica WJT36-NPBG1]|jgi:hypothetical protein|nr:hypothetical protein [Myxacorys californica WJT36-NPBG1]